MTQRAMAATANASTVAHHSATITVPAGYDAVLAYDDTKVKTISKLRPLACLRRNRRYQ